MTLPPQRIIAALGVALLLTTPAPELLAQEAQETVVYDVSIDAR